jgi:sec-independent protein translocase protein TatC
MISAPTHRLTLPVGLFLKKTKLVSSKDMPFLDHLEELRWRIIKSILGIIVGAIITFVFINQIFELLMLPTSSIENLSFQALTPYAMFMLKWGIAFVGGLVVAFPVLTYQVWKFVTPGLLENERKYVYPVIIFTFISFLGGVLFAYFVIIPFSLQFFASITVPDVQNNFSINSYVSYVLWILLAAGILFELPVLVLILSVIGLVTPPIHEALSSSFHTIFCNTISIYNSPRSY